MATLNRKLIRDLIHLRGQVVAITLVVACGVASFVAMRSTYYSLLISQQSYYETYRFAEVFAQLKRAPDTIAARIGEIPGVGTAEFRVVADVTLDVPGLDEPAKGRIISIPERQRPMLNDLYLREGRYVEAGQSNEVLISGAFATANQLEPGSTISAVINGKWQKLQIVGVALSPEYVYEIRSGEMFPDNRRSGVLWMSREALGPAFNMKGAFNDVAITLAPGAVEADVIQRLDELLATYGGFGAYNRDDQVSNHFLSGEIAELQVTGTFIPAIFLAITSLQVAKDDTYGCGYQAMEAKTLNEAGSKSSRRFGAHRFGRRQLHGASDCRKGSDRCRAKAYHAVTIGFYEGELLRRIDPQHRSLGQFFQDEIAIPLGLDFYIRLPESIPESRLAPLVDPSFSEMLFGFPIGMAVAILNPRSNFRRALLGSELAHDDKHIFARNFEIPAGGGVGTARAIAGAYSVFATGGKELGLHRETLQQLTAPAIPATHGFYDECIKGEAQFSLGFLKTGSGFLFGNPGSFGHPGAGGSFGFADPQAQIGYGYIPNRKGVTMGGDPRDVAIRNALYSATPAAK